MDCSLETRFMIIGLGNPGAFYASHRHNIGFMVLDVLAELYAFPAFKLKKNALMTEGLIQGQKVLLIKPQAYMNQSGQPVEPLVRFYKLPLTHVLVLHDDLDLAPGKVRLKKGGGSGGHNGLKDLDRCLGKEYWRLRLGIGHPGHASLVSHYVLCPFSKEEKKTWLNPLMEQIGLHIASLIQGERDLFLTRVNAQTPSSSSRGKEKPTQEGASK